MVEASGNLRRMPRGPFGEFGAHPVVACRRASSQSDQALRRSKPLFSPIGCSLLRFDQRLGDLLPDPERASQSEVEAPETDDE